MVDRHLLEQLRKRNARLQSGQYPENFLCKILWPAFRNFNSDLPIEIWSPLTAIVGRNGTGKSSVLFLAGSAYAPPGETGRTSGRTFNHFVPESYRDKIELGSEYGFEYEDGTQQTLRWHERQVGRVGRREWDRRRRRTRKQRTTLFFGYEKIISNAHLLAEHFEISQPIIARMLQTVGANEQRIVPLPKEVVRAVEIIVGKTYQSISRRSDIYSKLTDECWGYIIDESYSDLAAGSGEIAIIRMVDVISSVAENSLVLIDEPEAGIHQSSQERLLEFFIKQAIERDLQFIFTTHSNVFLEVLTPESIILLERFSPSGKIHARHTNSSLALRQITDRQYPKLRAIVEDEFAREILGQIVEWDVTIRDQIEIQAASSAGYQQILSNEFPAIFSRYQGDHATLVPVLVLDGDCRGIAFDRAREEFSNVVRVERELRRGTAYDKVVRRLGTILGCKRVSVRAAAKNFTKAQNRYRLDAHFIVRYVDHLDRFHVFLPGVGAPEVVIFEWLHQNIVLEPNLSIQDKLRGILPPDQWARFYSTFEEPLPQNGKSGIAKNRLFELQQQSEWMARAFTFALGLWLQSSRDFVDDVVHSFRSILEGLE